MSDELHLEHLGACRTAFHDAPEACSRILLCGEDNPQSAAPEHALFPYPPGCAGHRFCNDILGVTRHTYLATWRTNLCNPTWSMREARKRASDLVHLDAPWTTIVLLGRKVAEAFSKITDGALEPFAFGTLNTTNGVDPWGQDIPWTIDIVSLPHPSGRNFLWNDPRRALDARALLQEVAPEYPWGERDNVGLGYLPVEDES